jgi:metallophosphoesterase (TIGR03767 family)
MSEEEVRKFEKTSTTLDFTIIPECEPSNFGSTGAYFKLTYGKGDKIVKRKDLICDTLYPRFLNTKCNHCDCKLNDCKCKKEKKIKCNICKRGKKECKCEKKIIPLTTFVAMTDIHIIDSCNPSRSTFLGVFIEDLPVLSDSFRPYESFSMQVAETMVRKINAVEKGPILGRNFDFAICTGDLADSQSINELTNFVNMLDGTRIVPNPASKIYTGVQDDQPSEGYEFYYHPDPVPAGKEEDMYKTQFGYPEFPNILNQSMHPFCATGLKIPWFTCSGNHDHLIEGNFATSPYQLMNLFNQIAVGKIPGLGSKLIDLMTPLQAKLFALALQKQDANAILQIINKSVLREVPRSDKRRKFTASEFITAHFNTTAIPGKIGHGFTQFNVDNSVLYYTFKISDKITGIVLDTNNPNGNLIDINLSPNGSIGSRQILWFEEELRKRHSNYFNSQGELICTDNKDELIIVFGHHSIETLNNNFNSPDTFDNDPQRIMGPDFVKILHQYPNIILLVVGHEHLNRVTPYKDPRGFSSGFFQIVTSSHIDYPQQSRILEIGDNQDGTLSVFSTMIDHQSPANVNRGCFPTGPVRNCCGRSSVSVESSCNEKNSVDESSCCEEQEEYIISEIASISRELSYNDPFIVKKFDDAVERTGTRLDRNVELIIFNPLERCRPDTK